MGELESRDNYLPVPVNRATAKQLARIQQEALVRRAAIEAREGDAAYAAQCRRDNGYTLAAQTSLRAAALNDLVTQVSRGNPGLEVTLRGFEEAAALGARTIIYEYMTRR